MSTADRAGAHTIPAQFTSFVGRQAELDSLHEAVANSRLVTLTGTGGVGKTRLAIQLAAASTFDDGVWYIDLAPIAHASLVPITAARVLGLIDQPGQTTMETLLAFARSRQMLVVLDNCEHLLDACATLVVALLASAPGLKVVATSREPINIAGEAIWQVPSLSLADEAVELFADRARLAKRAFAVTAENADTVTEICRRLDGMPLAIELAAARVRALSLTEILDGLRDRFRLLTGSSRSAVRRQQTLRASVDWSHALLTEVERLLFRRLSVFLGGFDLDAAQAVAGADGLEPYQVLDQLTLLVDKSLVVAENTGDRTRYRLLETVRQYAQEKLGESGEADTIRSRHRDHYTSIAATLGMTGCNDIGLRVDRAESEIDNLRTAFGWSLENADIERALALASSLEPMWWMRARAREGRAWLQTAFSEVNSHVVISDVVRAQALADKAILDHFWAATTDTEQLHQALVIAREVDDPALLARVLAICGYITAFLEREDEARAFLTEAADLARAADDRWRLTEVLTWRAHAAVVAGDPVTARAAAKEGRELAQAVGDTFRWRECGIPLGWSLLVQGDVVGAIARFRAGMAERDVQPDPLLDVNYLCGLTSALAHHGEATAARDAAIEAVEAAGPSGDYFQGLAYLASTWAALAGGNVAAAQEASRAAWRPLSFQPSTAVAVRNDHARIALASGDLDGARRWADEAMPTVGGWHLAERLLTRARVASARRERDVAERAGHDALDCAARTGAYLSLPDIFECLADLAREVDRQQAARLFGAAEATRQRMGSVRLRVYDACYEASVATLRDAMEESEFDAAWAEGAAMSSDEAIAYAQRGHGGRKRPATGWASLTPAELDVVRLVCEGLPNKDIAARLFISPRTVQAHLAHVFTKLDLTSRVQLVQEAPRHTGQLSS